MLWTSVSPVYKADEKEFGFILIDGCGKRNP
jgi:hypothetical protein